MFIFIDIFTCLPSCINLSNINKSFVIKKFNFEAQLVNIFKEALIKS